MDADGGNQRRLTDHPDHEYLPSWTPDGRQITFVSWRHEERDGTRENHVYIMNADGSGQRRLVEESPGTSAPMVWLPDGCWLVFTRSHAGDDSTLKTWVMRADGTAEASMLLSAPGNQTEASWRPWSGVQIGCLD